MLQFKIGPAIESGVIPLVLAPIWLLYGYLQPLLDVVFKNDPATQVRCMESCSVKGEQTLGRLQQDSTCRMC